MDRHASDYRAWASPENLQFAGLLFHRSTAMGNPSLPSPEGGGKGFPPLAFHVDDGDKREPDTA